jgi:hypothetical protein
LLFFGFGGDLGFVGLPTSSVSVSAPWSLDDLVVFFFFFRSSFESGISSIGSLIGRAGGASFAVFDLVRARAFFPPSLT